MRVRYQKQSKLWWVCDNDGWYICCAATPKEARRKARQWYLYMTTQDEDVAQKYLNGEIQVK